MIPGIEALGHLPSIYDETGTKESGYAADGPYHCEDCVWRLQGTAFCTHPRVAHDPALHYLASVENGHPVVKINIEQGCCRYVRPPEKEPDGDE